MPRQVLTAPQGASVMPDLPNWAWHEYGMRVGFWRLKAALDAHGIAPSMTINGTVPAAYPRVTQAARDAGWEFMGHGFHQMATHLVEDQRAMIRDAIAALREAAGHDDCRLAGAGPDRDAGHARPAGGGRDSLLRRLGGGRSAVHAAHRAWADADHAVQCRAERHPDDDDPASSRARNCSTAPSRSSIGCMRRPRRRAPR